MGAINYKTSDYITIGVNTSYSPDGFESCEEMADCINQDVFELHEAVSDMLDSLSLWYYNVKIEPGYYDGFTIDIENNFPVAFDSWEDKRDAQKEITEIKAFLLSCVEIGLCQVKPGWCMAYLSYQESIKGIKAAIAEMRREVMATPTWLWYEREQYPSPALCRSQLKVAATAAGCRVQHC